MTCSNCGLANDSAARFCANCGTALSPAPMGSAPMGSAPMGGAPLRGAPFRAFQRNSVSKNIGIGCLVALLIFMFLGLSCTRSCFRYRRFYTHHRYY